MQHQNLFVFDIETIPDISAAKKLLKLENAKEKEVRKALEQYHLELTNQKSSFLRQPFHKVLTIGFLEANIVRDFDGNEFYKIVEIRCGGESNTQESDLIKGFFSHLKKIQPRFVSFNGRNFDLPVLKYAAMKHNIEAGWFYKLGDKWNSYNQRYSLDWHCDLADAFSDFGASARVKMNELCAAFDLPGKIDVDGSQVLQLFDDNKIDEIRNYCESDVINTYLLYLIYQHHCGNMSNESFTKSKKDLKDFMQNKSASKPHFLEFINYL